MSAAADYHLKSLKFHQTGICFALLFDCGLSPHRLADISQPRKASRIVS
jgi:hypothetical protein